MLTIHWEYLLRIHLCNQADSHSIVVDGILGSTGKDHSFAAEGERPEREQVLHPIKSRPGTEDLRIVGLYKINDLKDSALRQDLGADIWRSGA